ncbi:MAG TPA: hypothetical protein P5059_00550 [Candidatus Dojkabacteria bacterium]|nr:hypothetical protein [Candidatus Dojkabacteria bacterium]
MSKIYHFLPLLATNVPLIFKSGQECITTSYVLRWNDYYYNTIF